MPRVAPIKTATVTRRRRRTDTPVVRKTFSLHADVVEAVDEAVSSGDAENLSAFVETAIQEKLLRSKRARLYDAYESAARDARFMADMNATSRRFDGTSADGLRDD